MKELTFYKKVMQVNIKNSMELRTSFLLSVLGMVLNNSAFIILWVGLSHQTGVINGWTSVDIVGMLGYSALSFGLVFFFGSAVRTIPRYALDGTFDQFLLAPKSLLIRTITSKFDTSTIGDIVFGVLCILYYIFANHLSLVQVGLVIFFVVITAVIYFGVILVINSLAFYFRDGQSVAQSLSELFLTPTLFHGGAFTGGLRFFFTFVVPCLAVAALPIEAIRDLSLSKTLLLVLLTFFWLFFSLWFFKKAVRRYESANFMTFGQ
jgi:ABC-2 type transport system permease protein